MIYYGQSDVLYLDLSKAFDTIPHDLLILKLKYYGFHGSPLKWLCSYLSERQQRVFISGVPSAWLPVTFDVPQGSILGPLLFLLYINDLPISVRHSKIALFADDAKCVINVKSVASCIELQGDIDSIFSWSQKWPLIFNISKCFIITFTSLRNPVSFNYSMNGVALKRVTEVQDLGITLDSALRWNIHVKNIISKANRVSGLIKRTHR